MATGESYFAGHHFLSSQSEHVFDFDESDVWNTTSVALSSSPEEGGTAVPMRSSRSRKKSSSPSSLPVNIPDWSKILRGDYRENRYDDDVEDREGGVWFPPHEFLARQRSTTTSFSVHEGNGRTLKGRDLSRVRNAIWKQTGFED